MKIDDELDQIEEQYPDEGDGLLAPIASFSAPFVAIAFPATAAIVGGVAVVRDFMTRDRALGRLQTLYQALRARLDEHVTEDKIRESLENADAQEALIAAVLQTLRMPSDEKIRRFGLVLGSVLSANTPDWQLATELIRDLEELNDRDIEVLGILWSVQRDVAAVGNDRMPTAASDYTGTWDRVIGFAAEHRIDRDALYSRCARLTGFGMAIEVPRNDVRQGPADHCFRLTGTSVSLLRALGYWST